MRTLQWMSSCVLLLSVFCSSAGATEALPVLDFCALKPKAVSAAHQKQRVIVFGVGNLKMVESGEDRLNEKGEKIGRSSILRSINGAKQFSDVFTAQFPMRRFYSLMAPKPGKNAWATAETLSVSQVAGHLKKMVKSSGAFLAYSAACADYIAVPRLTAYEPTWNVRKVERKVKGKKSPASWSPCRFSRLWRSPFSAGKAINLSWWTGSRKKGEECSIRSRTWALLPWPHRRRGTRCLEKNSRVERRNSSDTRKS